MHEIIEKIYKLFKQSSGVCTDTRKIEKDCMFIALKGENFNGNDFAVKALECGAKWAVIDNKELFDTYIQENKFSKFLDYRVLELDKELEQEKNINESDFSLEDILDNDQSDETCLFTDICPLILVEDTLLALQQLSRYHRLKYKIPVIAITGTNGKTTTKELIAACLSTTFSVVYTKGNLNNHIGVPLTLLSINSSTQIAVIEMGASAPGEIATLVRLACPSFGIITNVGKAHLLGFGSFEGVKKTKGELYDNIREYKKIAFVNVDNPYLMEMVNQRPNMQIVPYGLNNNGAQIIHGNKDNPYLELLVPNPSFLAKPAKILVKTKLIGDYNADNVLAALCISTYFAVSTEDAVRAIENYEPSNNRSQMTKTEKNTLIIDAYNANPTSMRASLENFSKLNFSSKVLILGDMLELGEDSINEHKEIISLALSLKTTRLFLVGDEFAKALLKYDLEGSVKDVITTIESFSDSTFLLQRLLEINLQNSCILIKGSRGTKLETIFPAL